MNEEERISFGLDEVYEVFPEYYRLCVNNFDDVALPPLDEWIEYLKTTTIPDSAVSHGMKLCIDCFCYFQMRIYYSLYRTQVTSYIEFSKTTLISHLERIFS